ncbi:MAG: hypothetical protein OEQ39_05650 [Gammaproteobacteria bacterium]|nr:hypothetical protein [Gammaproteobacteria bacterium]
MPRGYRQSRRDANHKEIVDYARSIGFSVLEVHSIAGGLDLVVGIFNRIDQRVEIKDGSKVPSQRKLTPSEMEAFALWRGRKPIIWESTDDVDATRAKILEELPF